MMQQMEETGTLEQMERKKMLADKKAAAEKAAAQKAAAQKAAAEKAAAKTAAAETAAANAKMRAKAAETVVLKEAAVRLEEERVTAWDDLDRRFRNLHQVSALKVGTDAMSLLGKTIVFTGTFTMARVDATKAAEAAGAKVDSSITENTSILVAGWGAGAEERKKAKAEGVEIWTEDQFVAAVGGRGCAIAITSTGSLLGVPCVCME
jgi:NAD-dependent DNA ligase